MNSVSHAQARARIEAGAHLVTANNRLARHLELTFASQQRCDAWESVSILPWKAWLVQLYQQLSKNGDVKKLLLTPNQENTLWVEIVGDWNRSQPSLAQFLQPDVAAVNAMKAWHLCYDWQVPETKLSRQTLPHNGLLLDWFHTFERVCHRQNLVSTVQLPGLLIEASTQNKLPFPKDLVLAGFDEFTPLQNQFLDHLASQGCSVFELVEVQHKAAIRIMPCPDAEQEIEQAAAWAVEHSLHRTTSRIGVLIPDLSERLQQVERIFDNICHPERLYQANRTGVNHYNISLGSPLGEQPMVRDALLLLELCCQSLSINTITRLLNSPWIGDYAQEIAQRADLDLHLRKFGQLDYALAQLVKLGEFNTPQLSTRLKALQQLLKDSQVHSYHQAAELFANLLQISGWPGEKSLDSHDYQIREHFFHLLDDFSRLDHVSSYRSLSDALHRLRRLSQQMLFQAQSAPAQIQVMGLLEATGQSFDALWVTGMTLDRWPPAPHPNPLLPLSLQRELGMPRSSAARELTVAKHMMQRLRQNASEIIYSHALFDGDTELKVSTLISTFSVDRNREQTAEHPLYRLSPCDRLESINDYQAPALKLDTSDKAVAGGVELLKDQAVCPFRAFACHRLHANAPETMRPGIDQRNKGKLLHKCLELIWKKLKHQENLLASSTQERNTLIADTVTTTVDNSQLTARIGKQIGALEVRRLSYLLNQWLEFEAKRPAFKVIACEQKKKCESAVCLCRSASIVSICWLTAAWPSWIIKVVHQRSSDGPKIALQNLNYRSTPSLLSNQLQQ